MKMINWNNKVVAALAAAGFVASGQLASADEVLTFDGTGPNGSGIDDTYGDNLTTTPNIGVTWTSTTTSTWDSYPSWDGRGPVGQTEYRNGDTLSVFFSPDAGFGVFVSAFDLDEFAGGGNSIVNWALLDAGSSTLFSGTWDDFSDAVGGNGGRTTIVTGMDAGSATFGQLELQLDLISGTGSYQAVDNLTFGQVTAVPEPTSAGLIGLGLGAMLLRRKKKS